MYVKLHNSSINFLVNPYLNEDSTDRTYLKIDGKCNII